MSIYTFICVFPDGSGPWSGLSSLTGERPGSHHGHGRSMGMRMRFNGNDGNIDGNDGNMDGNDGNDGNMNGKPSGNETWSAGKSTS